LITENIIQQNKPNHALLIMDILDYSSLFEIETVNSKIYILIVLY